MTKKKIDPCILLQQIKNICQQEVRNTTARDDNAQADRMLTIETHAEAMALRIIELEKCYAH